MGGQYESNPYTADEEVFVNRAAHFLPQEDEGERPALVIAGAMIFGHVKDGELRVSVDLDEVNERLMRADSTVPLRVTVQGREVFRDDKLAPLR